MNKTNETTPRPEAGSEIIVLGIASAETKGGGDEMREPLGKITVPGICEE